MDFFHTHISKKSYKHVQKTLNSNFLSEGRIVQQFENKLSRQLGLVNPIAVNSGTSALHLALKIADVEPGDEVILPAQTFVSTGSVILMAGAKPVFADIQYKTGNIDPGSIKQKITPLTKAIMIVHWGGYPCDLDEINPIAKKNRLAVIEDAAHALGATYKNKPVGSISRFTAFSFQATKELTTGDGGAICCKSKKDSLRAKSLRWFGIDRTHSKPSILGERQYDINEVGFKYHMNDLAASLGLGNLEDFLKNLRRRRSIASHYRKELGKIAGLKLLDYQDDRESAYWLFTILVENRLDFIKKLKTRKIPTSVVHLRIDRNSIFGGITPNLGNQEKFDQNQVSIPIHDALSEQDVEKIISAIKSGW